MARTLIDGSDDIQPGTLTRALLNTTTAGSAIITKVIAGSNISLTQTGADAGTGDVTVSVGANPAFSGTTVVGGSGALNSGLSLDAIGPIAARSGVIELETWRDFAPGSTVTTSGGTLSGGGPQNRTDSCYWQATATGQSITFDIGTARPVQWIALGAWWQNDASQVPYSYVLDCSPDNATWTTIATVAANTSPVMLAKYAGAAARYYRLTINAFRSGKSAAYITGVQLLGNAFSAHSGRDMWTCNNGGNNVLLAASGNVGIGVASPTHNLDVGGTINATGVISGDGSGLTNIPAGAFSYTSPGTGAVARSAAAKFGDEISVKDYGAQGNAILVTGACSITSGAAALTVAGASFTAADVGKSILVPGAGAAGGVLNTTISGYTSATQVTLAANASTTLSASSQTVCYGTDDTVAAQKALTYGQSIGAACFFPAGNYYISGASVTGACSITSGANALTVAGGSFAAADVGKFIAVPGAGASGATLYTTISAYTSATQVTLAANASTTLSSSSQTVLWGGIGVSSASATYRGLFYSASPACSIRGDGARGTNLMFAPGAYNGLSVIGSSGSITAESMLRIEGMSLYKSDRQGAGLCLNTLAHIDVKDIFAEGWNLGLWCFDVQQSVLENVVCFQNNGGAQFQKNSFTQPNALLLLNCTFGLNYNFGLDAQNPATFKMVGGSIESNGYPGGNSTSTANSIWGARVIINTSLTEGSIAAHFDGVYIENNGSPTSGVGIGDIYYSNSASESMLSVTNCSFQRHASFCTNNIAISTSGGFRHKIRLQNGHKGYSDYTASSSRPYWQVFSSTDPIEVDDTGSLYVNNAVEGPQATAMYGVPSSMRCAQSNLGGYVRFNGTGTPAIASNFGIYSVTRNSAGNYTITFSRAQTAAGSRCYDVGLNASGSWYLVSETSTTFTIQTVNLSGAATDFNTIMVKWNADPTQ